MIMGIFYCQPYIENLDRYALLGLALPRQTWHWQDPDSTGYDV